jgi:hypothetical protein
MTTGVTLSCSAVGYGTLYTVDFNSDSANEVEVTHRFSNPVITLATPITLTDSTGNNEKIVNIGFLTNSFDLSFMLHDGPGSFNFASPTTNYEKIMFMAWYGAYLTITLTLNGTAFTGSIENASIPFKAGQKDLSMNGTLSFHKGQQLVTLGYGT